MPLKIIRHWKVSIREIATITGQQPVVTKAKKSVAGFKIRDGMPVGLMP